VGRREERLRFGVFWVLEGYQDSGGEKYVHESN
jgi:hypothetical protein